MGGPPVAVLFGHLRSCHADCWRIIRHAEDAIWIGHLRQVPEGIVLPTRTPDYRPW